jgi:hypothetical protein
MSAAAYFQQNPDVAAAYQQNTYGLTPEQFAQVHYERYGQTEQRAQPAVVEQITSGSLSELPAYFQQNPDVAASYVQNTYGLTPQQFAAEHYARYGQNEQRVSPTGAPAIIPPKTTTTTGTRTGTTTGTTTGTARTTVIPYFTQNPDVAASYAQNNYGMTPEQFAAYHFANYGVGEQRAAPTTSPFANATQGFANNFNTYTSIPIGAQYNPGVVGGAGSPYSQIMSQMRPVGNPYIGVSSNQPMGGYDPTIYDPNLLSNFVRQRAAELTAAGLPAPYGYDGGGDGASGAGDGAGSASGDSGPGGAADGGSGPGDGPGTGAGWYMGGLIDRVSGKNPSGPDDGQINAQIGEYVVKKSSVDKYGKGLLDMINDGKISAKKMKSLLG